MGIRETAKQIPLLQSTYRRLQSKRTARRLQDMNTEDIFTDIFRENSWGGEESVSGRGSDPDQTRRVSEYLPSLIARMGVTSLLDIPCGDFNWMKQVNLGDVHYVGADIVEDLIARNTEAHGSRRIQFQKINIITDSLPNVDLIFCRDCLVHLSHADALAAIRNICRNDSGYLLTTTFTDHAKNRDIATGQWRQINLREAPFHFPEPMEILNERHETFTDKSLGLWRISDIKPVVASL